MAEKKDTRSRAWSFIVYPESAPENWEAIIDELHIEWAHSPLHDRDTNPTGETKKAHWHCLLQFTNVKSFDQVYEICKLVNSPAPQRCHNTRSLARYFCHLDNPEKAQYSVTDIKCFGGLDFNDLLKPSASQVYEIIGEMRAWIDDKHIYEFQDLMDEAYSEEHFNEWVPVLVSHSTVLFRYLNSKRYRAEKMQHNELVAGQAAGWVDRDTFYQLCIITCAICRIPRSQGFYSNRARKPGSPAAPSLLYTDTDNPGRNVPGVSRNAATYRCTSSHSELRCSRATCK